MAVSGAVALRGISAPDRVSERRHDVAAIRPILKPQRLAQTGIAASTRDRRDSDAIPKSSCSRANYPSYPPVSPRCGVLSSRRGAHGVNRLRGGLGTLRRSQEPVFGRRPRGAAPGPQELPLDVVYFPSSQGLGPQRDGRAFWPPVLGGGAGVRRSSRPRTSPEARHRARQCRSPSAPSSEILGISGRPEISFLHDALRASLPRQRRRPGTLHAGARQVLRGNAGSPHHPAAG